MIASIGGRYFAMDRDNNWKRTKLAYSVLLADASFHEPDWQSALADAYKRGESDEFVTPTVLGAYFGLKNSDALIFFNFRADRAIHACFC